MNPLDMDRIFSEEVDKVGIPKASRDAAGPVMCGQWSRQRAGLDLLNPQGLIPLLFEVHWLNVNEEINFARNNISRWNLLVLEV